MKRNRRTACGAAILEFAAVIVLGLPLAIMFIFIGVETTHYFAIKSAMDVGARRAARELVIDYNNTGTMNDAVAFLTMPGYIVNSNQFTVTWDTASPPASVSVSCNYPAGGAPGLAPFPNGPLKYLTEACQFYLGNL
ncbi:MAG TPA: hypothetical protein V6D22_01260, partial [Candidatus Obscuribacterales bacterium]